MTGTAFAIAIFSQCIYQFTNWHFLLHFPIANCIQCISLTECQHWLPTDLSNGDAAGSSVCNCSQLLTHTHTHICTHAHSCSHTALATVILFSLRARLRNQSNRRPLINIICRCTKSLGTPLDYVFRALWANAEGIPTVWPMQNPHHHNYHNDSQSTGW